MEAVVEFMTKKTRRRFSDEFKADAVSQVIDQGYSVSEAARRLGVERSVLDRWCRQHRHLTSDSPARQAKPALARTFIRFRADC